MINEAKRLSENFCKGKVRRDITTYMRAIEKAYCDIGEINNVIYFAFWVHQ